MRRLFGPYELVHIGRQAALRDQRRVQIAHRARGGVAGIGKEGLARLFAFAVRPLERRARHEHLAADVDPARRTAAKAEWNRPDRSHVGRHVLAAGAVASRGADEQPPIPVGQRDAQPVDLQLGDVPDRLGAEAGSLADALVERLQLVVAVGVVETEHRRDVLDRREAFNGTTGHTLGRRVGRDEIRMLGLETFQLVEQAVELFVGDVGVAVDVVALFVVADQVAELVDAPGRIPLGHRSRDST